MKESVRTEWFETLDSTNNEALRRIDKLDSLSVIAARTQTAGRGQRGNRWLASPGENLTFSLVFKPEGGIPAADGFLIGQAASVAVRRYLDGQGIPVRIKWPNDIYLRNRKICGMLIENGLDGDRIRSSVIGIGINMNQRLFPPELVNPVSMTLATGRTYDTGRELEEVCRFLTGALDLLSSEAGRSSLLREYGESLYRAGVFADYVRCADGSVFTARIIGTGPDGRLLVENKKGERESFAFKEISYII